MGLCDDAGKNGDGTGDDFWAHLLSLGWLYQSKAYLALSVVIPIAALLVGVNFPPYAVAAMMIVFEIIFSVLLFMEVLTLSGKKKPQPAE